MYFNIKYIYILLFLCLFLSLNNEHNYFSLFPFNTKKRPKISIFIPIYNKELYIDKCIKNLQNQTPKDIEIIAVNDCSEDNSLNILNDLAKNDSRIKIVNNDINHGLLYSRAIGILNSTGEYLMNLDSDDEIYDNECLEYLYNKTLSFKVDIIAFNVHFEVTNTTVKCNYDNEILLQPKLYKKNFLENNDLSDYLIWNKLIKKEIFLKAYEDFKIAIYNGKWNYFEDDVWNTLVSKYAQSKLCLDKLVYIYNNNSDSLMNNRTSIVEFQNLIYRFEMYNHIKYHLFEFLF